MSTITTIKELYDWAVKNGVENLGVGLQWADGGGTYCGNSYIEGAFDIIVSVESTNNGEDYVLLESC